MTDIHLRQRPTAPDPGLLVASAAAFGGFVTILVFVLLTGGTDAFDAAIASRVGLLQGTTRSALARAVTSFGSPAVVLTVAVVAILGLWLQTRRLWASAVLASSVVATASLVTLLKISVARARPNATALVASPERQLSFPSGHTTDGTLVYVLAALMLTARWRNGPARLVATGSAAALAVLIGLSRIYLGVHWATDVLAGWLLAAGVVAASYFTASSLGLADDHTSDRNKPLPHQQLPARHLL